MAQKQRTLFNQKKIEAKETANNFMVDRVFTFVADYAQNMYLPNFASEQPGEVYYYSPLNVYPFGIVDAAVEPSHLTALIYFEGDGKKGGNNVASMLWFELQRKGLIAGASAKELNIVMDNCAGQNKNRMVLRLLHYLVKRKVCKIARAIFLIKGHTKNDCDRLFNLLKKEYRKENIYTPNQLMDHANRHDDVTAIKFEPDDFKDWDALQHKYMTVPSPVNVNHIFTVSDTDPNTMLMQECDGAEAVSKVFIRKDYRDLDDWCLEEPQTIDKPGLQDIKWVELYKHWRPLVPQEHHNDYEYFKNDPGSERLDAVRKHSRDARSQRATRSRTTDKTTTKNNNKKRATKKARKSLK